MHADASSSPVWQRLTALAALPQPAIADLFTAEPHRSTYCRAEGAGITLDYSRQRCSASVVELLASLAEDVSLRERIAAMYRGDIANPTENRPALHTALRRERAPYAEEVLKERSRMLEFAEAVRRGTVRGSGGEAFDLVVNIGIGGSDLGPSMAVDALYPFAGGAPRVAFVSNIDGCRLADLIAMADPRRTLFIVCSKTFTTQETRANAESARGWLVSKLGIESVPAHFAAVSVNSAAMDEYGIHPDRRFAIWDWVGGRYSVWSSVGVSLAIAIGEQAFREFLAGAAAMDEHFLSAPWQQNLPALMGLIGIWNINFLKLQTLAVLPYDERLGRFPAYLQQLDMESNGKRVRSDGSLAFCETAPLVWGEPGSNAQHSFFQMLLQGTPCAALDFILPALSSCGDSVSHDLAAANCLAQAEAFAFGQQSNDPHKVHEGNRPSSILMFQQLEPRALGALVSLYEHKVFVQSVVWGINAFDQWGVELGKRLAAAIAPLISGNGRAAASSLRGTLEAFTRLRHLSPPR